MPCDVPRYLVPFHPKRIPHVFADVLIIGGGIAGLRAAMEIDPVVVTATRVEQRSFDVPASIDSIDQQRIQEGQALINLSENPVQHSGRGGAFCAPVGTAPA